jgi:hypothetical protein
VEDEDKLGARLRKIQFSVEHAVGQLVDFESKVAGDHLGGLKQK